MSKMAWLPDLRAGKEAVRRHREHCINDTLPPCENEIRAALKETGALDRIKKLEEQVDALSLALLVERSL